MCVHLQIELRKVIVEMTYFEHLHVLENSREQKCQLKGTHRPGRILYLFLLCCSN